jgi:intracellular multiplication protein IcmO
LREAVSPVALIGTIAPVLVWLRDRKGVALNIDVIRFSIELRWIWKLAMEKIVLLRDPDTGAVRELDVGAEIPEDITWPLKSYLGELPGYDPSVPLDKQKGDEPSKQHGYAQRLSRSSRCRSATYFGSRTAISTCATWC